MSVFHSVVIRETPPSKRPRIWSNYKSNDDASEQTQTGNGTNNMKVASFVKGRNFKI